MGNLTNNFIDLDVYNLIYKNANINELRRKLFCNLIIDSGRGLTLIWSIENVMHIALYLWKVVQEYLYSQLK